jgi:signal transduction histidine kinase
MTVLVSVVPLLLLGGLSIVVSRTVLESAGQRQVSIILGEERRFVTTVMEEVESLVANLSGLDVLQQVLDRPRGTTGDFDRLATQAKIGYILSGYIDLKGLVSIDVFAPGGEVFHVGDTLELNQPRLDLVARLREQAGHSASVVYWSGVEDNINTASAFRKVITAVKRLRSHGGSDQESLLVVSFDPGVLNQQNLSGSEDFSIIVDGQNRTVIHPDEAQWGLPVPPEILGPVRAHQNPFPFSTAQGSFLVHSLPLDKGSWLLLHFSSQGSLQAGTLALVLGTFLILGILLVIVVLVVRRISVRIVQPIGAITQGFQALQAEVPAVPGHLAAASRDEIGTLVLFYNEFLDAYVEKKKTEAELELRQQELRDLNRTLEQRIETEVAASRDKDGMLIQQSRQASMGEMIGNIAHQWRQPLNTLALLVQELEFEFEDRTLDSAGVRDFAAQMLGVIDRMSTTIDDFRDFFKPNKEKVTFSVEATVLTTLSFVEAAFKSHSIEIRVEKENPGVLLGYPNEFSQVLLNILNNAKDVLVDRNPEQKVVRIRIGTLEGHQVVAVADSGGGIAPAVLPKIFDPYFTTKGPGKGTGIGLFMSRTIIERNMGGRLSVRNTTFGPGLTGAEFILEW